MKAAQSFLLSICAALSACQSVNHETEKPVTSIPLNESQAVVGLCQKGNPLVMSFNASTGLFNVFRCDSNSSVGFQSVMKSKALWGKATKAGIYQNTHMGIPDNAEDYPQGIALIFNGQFQSVHGILNTEKQSRLRSLASPTLEDNQMSHGCINIEDNVFRDMNDYYRKLISHGDIRAYPPIIVLKPDA